MGRGLESRSLNERSGYLAAQKPKDTDYKTEIIAQFGARWEVKRTKFPHIERVFYEVQDAKEGIYTPAFYFDQATEDAPSILHGDWYTESGVYIPLNSFIDRTQEWLIAQNASSQDQLQVGVVVHVWDNELQDRSLLAKPDSLREEIRKLNPGGHEPELLRIDTSAGFAVVRSTVLQTGFLFSPDFPHEEGHFRSLLGEMHDSLGQTLPAPFFQQSLDAILADATGQLSHGNSNHFSLRN